MTTNEKVASLKKHKAWATGLFLLMMGLYILSIYLSQQNTGNWVGYLKAFSEAAMVGALADWFAVTALFNYPLGIRIPHTNIIQNSKDAIGDNLGTFVVDNFINAQNIKPYIVQLKVTDIGIQWMQKEKNQQLIATELKKQLHNALLSIDGEQAQRFLQQQSSAILQQLSLHQPIAQTLQYLIHQKEFDAAIGSVAGQIAIMVEQNETLVHQKVKENSYFFIPGFVNNKIADKIASGIVEFLVQIQQDEQHPVRAEIKTYLLNFSEQLATEQKWIDQIDQLKHQLIASDNMQKYMGSLWQYASNLIEKYLHPDNVTFEVKLSQIIQKNIAKWQADDSKKEQIDIWIRKKLYYYLLKNANKIGEIISQTVNQWDGKELSEKLELEVGKDLQFIRINGTLVGGLVGLIIYALTQLFI